MTNTNQTKWYFQRVLVHNTFLGLFFKSLTGLLLIHYGLQFCIFTEFLCVQTYVSVSMCVSCAFSFFLKKNYFSGLFIFWFSKEKKKAWSWVGREDLGRVGEEKLWLDILCEDKFIFNKNIHTYGIIISGWRGGRFNSQHLHDQSWPCITPVSGNLIPFSGLHWHQAGTHVVYRHICSQNTHTHKINK